MLWADLHSIHQRFIHLQCDYVNCSLVYGLFVHALASSSILTSLTSVCLFVVGYGLMGGDWISLA